MGPGPGAARRPSRQADQRHDAAPEGRRLSAHRPDGGRQYQPDRGLARRHRHHQEAAGGHRPTTSSPTHGPASPFRGPTSSSSAGAWCKWTARTSSASRPSRSRSRPTTRASSRSRRPICGSSAKGQLPVARHRANDRRPVRSSWFHEHLGVSGQQDPAYDQVKVYTITDRPVYRPGTPVRFKFWIARARYDQPEPRNSPARPFTVEIQNPEGGKGLHQGLHGRRVRGLRRLVRAAVGRDAGGLSGLHASAAAAARSGSRSTRSPSSR